MTASNVAARAAVIACVALAACSSDRNNVREFSLLRTALVQKISGTGNEFELTRALIDEAQMPLMLAEVKQHDVRATLIPIGQNGPVITWSAPDGTTLSLREGILVGSRGLSPDLMSAAVPSLNDLRAGKTFTRSHYFLGHDDQTERADFTCSGQVIGQTVLEIFEHRHQVTQITESCTGPAGAFANDYWVENGGEVRQSRQWVGPTVGFLELQRLDG